MQRIDSPAPERLGEYNSELFEAATLLGKHKPSYRLDTEENIKAFREVKPFFSEAVQSYQESLSGHPSLEISGFEVIYGSVGVGERYSKIVVADKWHRDPDHQILAANFNPTEFLVGFGQDVELPHVSVTDQMWFGTDSFGLIPDDELTNRYAFEIEPGSESQFLGFSGLTYHRSPKNTTATDKLRMVVVAGLTTDTSR